VVSNASQVQRGPESQQIEYDEEDDEEGEEEEDYEEDENEATK
jgi:hypothetical protein